MDKIHTSSAHGDYESPKDMIERLSYFFDWDLDVCAERPNVCKNFFTREDDGLSRDWLGLCWMNPPYGKKRRIGDWIAKAREQGAIYGDTTVVCLLPARTGTRWWHDNVPYANFVVFIEGRLRFDLPGGEAAPHSAGFPSAFVVFGKLNATQKAALSLYGWALEVMPHASKPRN